MSTSEQAKTGARSEVSTAPKRRTYARKPYQLSPPRIGKKILQLRKKKRISGKELARRLGIERTNLTRLERGHTSARITLFRQIAIALGVSLEELIG